MAPKEGKASILSSGHPPSSHFKVTVCTALDAGGSIQLRAACPSPSADRSRFLVLKKKVIQMTEAASVCKSIVNEKWNQNTRTRT
jgi:hypothetical protein